jgi:hypothetical protein
MDAAQETAAINNNEHIIIPLSQVISVVKHSVQVRQNSDDCDS